MSKPKRGISLLAALVTLTGATPLARPADAAVNPQPCTAEQRAYAQGVADGSCSNGGTLDFCWNNNGGSSFAWTCA